MSDNRSVKRSIVSRRITHTRRFMAEDDVDKVKTKFGELKSAFADFEFVHEEYHSTLDQDDLIEESSEYFESFLRTYTVAMQEFRDFIRSSENTNTSNNSIGSSHTRVPVLPEPEIFSGSPIDYPLWKSSFEALVHNTEITAEQKMFLLRKFTKDEAREAIESLFMIPSGLAYISAMKILADRFGSPIKVVSALRNKLETWPKIQNKDNSLLLKFSDFLNQVNIAATQYPSLTIYNDEFENSKLVSKLPQWLATKWVEHIVDFPRFPDFDTFCKFISQRAKIANHPLLESNSSSSYTKMVDSSIIRENHHTNNQVQKNRHTLMDNSCNNLTRNTKPNWSVFENRVPQASRVLLGIGQGGAPPRPRRASTLEDGRHTSLSKCLFCGGGHMCWDCENPNKLNIDRIREIILHNKLCFSCLKTGHISSHCSERLSCKFCGDNHPSILHGNKAYSPRTNSFITHSTFQNKNEAYYNMTVPIRVTVGRKSVVTLALLDSQSNSHFISEKLKRDLSLNGHPTTIELSTINGRERLNTDVVEDIGISSLDGENPPINLKRCFVRQHIPYEANGFISKEELVKWPHLSKFSTLRSEITRDVGMLIGYTCHSAFIPLDLAVGGLHEPFGVKGCLGWYFMGPSSTSSSSSSMQSPSSYSENCLVLRSNCKEIFLPNESVSNPLDEEAPSVEDKRFIDIMEGQMIQRDDFKYEVPLPLKEEKILPNNRLAAIKRLNSLKIKLSKNRLLRDKYIEVMEENLSNGYAELVPYNNLRRRDGQVWYIPHHGVPKGRDKVRVVFDCSAKFENMCLNDVLIPGPNLLNNMLGILLRFRTSHIAFTCDVKRMYYNFFVPPEYRDYLRFLWWPGGDLNAEPLEYRMKVHIFGAVSSGAVATYGMRRIVQDFGQDFPMSVKDFVSQNFYVDDGVVSKPSILEAKDLFINTKALLAKGGLQLHKIISNSEDLNKSVDKEDSAPLAEDGLHSVLGLEWDIVKDTLVIPFKIRCSKISRRSILASVASIFDPFGLIAPLVLQGRLIFHQMEGVSWDESPSPDICLKFKKWRSLIQEMSSFKIPRCQIPNFVFDNVEIHYFCDASQTAISSCAYARFIGLLGEVHISFVMGKCKVVPNKPTLTIPRLELMAAVLSTKLAMIIRKELKWSFKEFFWTDSNIVLGYIKNTTKRFKIFIANRIQMIHNVTNTNNWFHIDTKENPADDGSRARLTHRWYHGPKLLITFKDPPSQCIISDLPEICLSSHLYSVFQIRPFKNWRATIRVWSWVRRFIQNCSKKEKISQTFLIANELKEAESLIIKIIQSRDFGDEFRSLTSAQHVSSSSSIKNLDPFVDEKGVIRVGGRIRRADLNFETRFPVILTAKHDISQCIIQHFHTQTFHQGKGATLAEIRYNGFWILGANRMVKSIIKSCIPCKKLRGMPCSQKMADLPADRVNPGPVFTNVGVDLFGPFKIQGPAGVNKRYGIIFTCLASRAIHLDMCFSLSTDSLLNVFRRFMAIRGPVSLIRCDQGSNFMGARRDLEKMGCSVEFIPPRASHFGGVWERMIASSKRVIEGILLGHGHIIDDDGLLTILAETANVVNSRPLDVHNLNDPSSVPLNVNQLLTMKSRRISIPVVSSNPCPRSYMIKRWKRVQFLSDLFWSRWRREILTLYQSRRKWCDTHHNLQVNDIVLVMDENVPRLSWKMARVKSVKFSKDNCVRTVTLESSDKKEFVRSVQDLIFLLR